MIRRPPRSTLFSLHDALPILKTYPLGRRHSKVQVSDFSVAWRRGGTPRSEEHTSELQSRPHLVCRLLLEKKKKKMLTSVYRAYCFHWCELNCLRLSIAPGYIE